MAALVLAEGLATPNQVMAYVKAKGSAVMQSFVNKSQGRLKEFIEHARQWDGAEAGAAKERESDWNIIEQLARKTCACGNGGCAWWALAEDFFQNNGPGPWRIGVDRGLLAASLRSVIQDSLLLMENLGIFFLAVAIIRRRLEHWN